MQKKDKGYTKRHRKRWDKGIHRDWLLWILMDYFIDHASWENKTFPFFWKGKLVKMIEVQRGQCFFTYKGLTDLLKGPKNNVSRKRVRNRVDILQKIEFLGLKPGHQYQIATVLNYDKYNPLPNSKAHKDAHKPPTNRPPIAHQSPTTNKLIKNYKEIIKNTPPLPPSFGDNGECGWPEGFQLDDSMVNYAIKHDIDPEKINLFFSDFHDWAIAKNIKRKDWKATFRMRVNNAPRYGKQFLKQKDAWEDL